ncbi:putative RNA-directed DNA polymerase from transposon BS [Trichonephila clavipes]|nr:putative RNA-directed DNA polymerase from transposon BS [Trichonephila clavipes]
MDPSCFGFRLASWNANGIKSRIVEVRDFIDKHHPDVFLIQESHLGPGDAIHIPNYTVYRNDRPRTTSNLSRGGTPWRRFHHLRRFQRPPYFLGLSEKRQPRQHYQKNLIDSTDTQIVAPTTPTRFGHNSASIIDFALTRNIHWLSQVESIAELSSDHNPLIISFDTNRRFAFPRRIVTTDWAAFRELLSPAHYTFQPITARTGEDVETQVADLTDAIINTHTLSSKPIRGREFLLRFGRDPSAHDRTEQSQKSLAVHARSERQKRVLNNIQNRLHRKIKAFQNKIWEGRTSSSRPRRRIPLGNVEGTEKEEVPSLRP